MKEKVAKYFKMRPTATRVFESADGELFKEKGDAILHANSLANKSVELHVAPSVENEQVVKDKPLMATGPVAKPAKKDPAKKD